MMQNPKIYFITLGCKVNSRETDGLRALFLQNGFDIAQTLTEADIVYVNSCTVTADGAAKSRSAVRRAKRTVPNATVILGGCLPQTDDTQSYGADIVVGNTKRADILPILHRYMRDKISVKNISPHSSDESFELLPVDGDEHTRAFLKVQDGCPRSCNYCIVTRARGDSRSMPADVVLSAARQLVSRGHKEIVLCGINLAYYESNGVDIAQLCLLLEKIPELARLRLGSLEPDRLTPDRIKRLAECSKLAPHFHISLQSGCDSVLSRMGRYYDTSEYLSILKALRSAFTQPSFTTDIMVGFPGETQQEFLQTVQFVQKAGFLNAHIFRYSKRPGTVAADMPNQISETEKKQRAATLLSAVQANGDAVKKHLLSLPDMFLAETKRADGSFEGTTGRYVHIVATGSDMQKGGLYPLDELTILDGRLT